MKTSRSVLVYLGVVTLLLGTQSLPAQSPKAVITGPKESREGDLVILDATQSQGQKYIWEMAETDKSFAQVENNTKVFFSAGLDPEPDGTVKPREFHFFLCVGGTNANGSPEISLAKHTVVIKPRYMPPRPNPPGPTPNPTPGPGVTVSALILYESADSNPDFQALLQVIRNSPELSKKILLIDKDAQTPDGMPLKKAVEALKFVGTDPLPQIVGLSSDGAFVAHANLPVLADKFLDLIKSWGLQ
jgi:hypothetical protein